MNDRFDIDSRRALLSALVPVAVILSAALVVCSCGGDDPWDAALEKTALPDAEETTISGGATPATGQRPATERPRQQPSADSGTGGESERASAVAARDQVIGLVLVLEGDRSCFAGKVRGYLDGRYASDFDAGGRLRLSVSPGAHTINVWDSWGQWEMEIEAAPGGSVEAWVYSFDENKEKIRRRAVTRQVGGELYVSVFCEGRIPMRDS